ncbi:MAG TPA: DUF6152 family protein [Magnetospirillaceae bacterium]|nr:DUF6152 family protein [Magnetospirillaceae bacterium]
MKSLAITTICALGLAAAGPALAHHSTAAYDMDNLASLQGTVKSISWSNPHIVFVVDIDGKEGAAAQAWSFEASSPGVLSRSGWSKRSLQPGDHATFSFAPLRSGGQGGFLLKVVLPDGQTLSYSLTPKED